MPQWQLDQIKEYKESAKEDLNDHSNEYLDFDSNREPDDHSNTSSNADSSDEFDSKKRKPGSSELFKYVRIGVRINLLSSWKGVLELLVFWVPTSAYVSSCTTS